MRLSQIVTLPSLVELMRLRSGRLTAEDEVTLQLKSGLRCIVRGKADDNAILAEIFLQDQYVPPADVPLKNPHTIVDVGANVGYAILYFLKLFPEAKITAFEPHPVHISLIKRHLQMNKFEDRVTLVEAAAGVKPDELEFIDNGAASSVVQHAATEESQNARRFRVPVVDWLEHLPTTIIDLLKLDAEGAEYDLLQDPRIDEVLRRTRIIALEWHNTPEYPEGQNWCSERLKSLGFQVFIGNVQYDRAGFLWACRN